MQKSGFISKAACHGYRPRRLTSYNVIQRDRLITRLARDRLVSRFIVAPAGYGKTSLAIDYAETMFSWGHVFWLNAKSPCFIRDLDDGDIASECLSVDPEAKLVIIEDVPQLDAQRVQQFSLEIDTLLAHGCEVIVTCVPSCDLVGGLQLDRLRLGAAELLLDDDEVEAAQDDEAGRAASSSVPPAYRVPALMWGKSPESEQRFVAGVLDEDLPADLQLVTATVLVLHRGSFERLAGICPISGMAADETPADYPHLGLDFEERRFEAAPLDAEVVSHALKGDLDSMVGRSQFSTRVELVRAWAEAALASRRTAGRACDVVRVLLPAKDRAQWLVENGRVLVRRGCFHAMQRLASGLYRAPFDAKDRIRILEALSCRMLGNEEHALLLAKRCAFDGTAHDDARAIGLMMTARLGKGVLRDNAADALETWRLSINARGGALAWHEALVLAWAARDEGVAGLANAWQAFREQGADDDVLCVVASWMYGLVQGNDGAAVAIDAAAEPVERYVRARLAEEEPGAADFLAASAGLSMEHAHMQGMPYFGGPLPAATLFELRRTEASILRQRHQYGQDLRRESSLQPRMPKDMPVAQLSRAKSKDARMAQVPILEVRAFGRFDVSLDGVPIELSRMRRKHTRELLVLLAANWGREVSIDSLAAAMWPTSDFSIARKNFYTTWSQLKRSLTLPDGTCPYLVRTRYGCRLNDLYARSDLAHLGDMCRELVLGRIDFDAWLEIYNEIEREYSGELLPVDSRNHLIEKARKEYGERLVDALSTASQRLVDAGNAQWGIWFARLALSHGPTREDVYVTLMRAQIAHGQRTAAMMTYLNCRRMLNDELGIDPSPETQSLYDGLLDS